LFLISKTKLMAFDRHVVSFKPGQQSACPAGWIVI